MLYVEDLRWEVCTKPALYLPTAVQSLNFVDNHQSQRRSDVPADERPSTGKRTQKSKDATVMSQADAKRLRQLIESEEKLPDNVLSLIVRPISNNDAASSKLRAENNGKHAGAGKPVRCWIARGGTAIPLPFEGVKDYSNVTEAHAALSQFGSVAQFHKLKGTSLYTLGTHTESGWKYQSFSTQNFSLK